MLANFEADGFAKIANIGSVYESCKSETIPDALSLLLLPYPPPPPPAPRPGRGKQPGPCGGIPRQAAD